MTALPYWILRIAAVPGPITGRITGVLGKGKPGMIGMYVYGFDADAFDGRGDVSAGMDREKAKRFSTAAEALAFYRTQSTVRPLRDDGAPNRPLTAFTMVVETVTEEVPS